MQEKGERKRKWINKSHSWERGVIAIPLVSIRRTSEQMNE